MASLIAQLVKNPCEMQETLVQFLSLIPWRRDRLPTQIFLGFPHGSVGKQSACNVRDLDSIPGLGRSPGEGKGYPLQYSGLENSMDCIVHGVTKSQKQLSNFHFHLYSNIVYFKFYFDIFIPTWYLLFVLYIMYLSFKKQLLESLMINCVTCTQHIIVYCLLIQSNNLCLLMILLIHSIMDEFVHMVHYG